MTAKAYAALESAVTAWLNKACENDEMPNVIIGDRTAELMAKAARNVLDACEESQAYGIREGCF